MIPSDCKVKALIALFVIFYQPLFAQESVDQKIVAKLDSALFRLIDIQREIESIHPFLKRLHPVAFVEGDHLYIFDMDSVSRHYRFQKKEPVPFPMAKGIKASFPLSSYNYRPTCVVGSDIFDAQTGYIFVFHEFIHCQQALTCEYALKEKLNIARIAQEQKNYSWELNHPFPYHDTLFVDAYTGFLSALEKKDDSKIREYRFKLKNILKPIDIEYLVWQEWKEGFARFIENKIRQKYQLKVNHGGSQTPYSRVTFYYGGDRFIQYFIQQKNQSKPDVEALFRFLLDYPE